MIYLINRMREGFGIATRRNSVTSPPTKSPAAKVYICPECLKEYTYKRSYQKHLATHIDITKLLKPAPDVLSEVKCGIDLSQAQEKTRHGNRYRGKEPSLKALSGIRQAQDAIIREADRQKKANASHGRRWQQTTYNWAYRYLVERDGEYCRVCGSDTRLEIEHIDCNIHNTKPTNLCLLCKTCNLKFRNVTTNEKRAILDSTTFKRDRENSRNNATLLMVQDVAGYDDGTSTQRANAILEIRFREWVYKTVSANKWIFKQDIIDAAPKVVDAASNLLSAIWQS